MAAFWSFWIPVTLLFWIYVAATVNNPQGAHFRIGFVMWLITGILPLAIYKMLSN